MEIFLIGMLVGHLVHCLSKRGTEKSVLTTNTCKTVKLKEEELPLVTSIYVCGRFVDCKIVSLKCEVNPSFKAYYLTLHTKSPFFNAWLNSCMMDEQPTKEDVSISSLGISLIGVFPCFIQRNVDGHIVTLSIDYLGEVK